MGKFLFLACLLLMPLSKALANQAEDKYQALLKAAQADPAKADWQALRFAYSETPEFKIYADPSVPERRVINDAFEAGDYSKILDSAKLIIARDFANVEAHRIASVAYKHLNNLTQYETEKAIADGLAKSIMTGDGFTPQTAYTVISVAEEYELLYSRGFSVRRQVLLKIDGHSFDVLSTVDIIGDKTQDYYFQIDRVLAAEVKALQSGQ